jgi:hypothetical protein
MAANRVNATRVHFTRLERAHIDFVRALSALQPHRIIGEADLADIEGRADHLRQAYRLFVNYIDAVAEDTMNSMADGDVDWLAVEMALFDATNDTDFSETADALHRAGVRFDSRVAA